jgi:hypothetical protein
VKSRQNWKKWAPAAIKLLRQPLALVSLILLIGIIAAEVASGTVRHVFTEYPASVGFGTSLITLAFTLSIVNQLVTQRNSLRWQEVCGITLKGLNDEVRTTRDLLWIAIFGKPKYENNNRITTEAKKTADESRFQWPPPTSDLSAGLSKALSHEQWAETGTVILRAARQQLREGLARWAPTTVLAGGDYRVLSPLAMLADVIEVLEYPLRDERMNPTGSIEDKYRKPLGVLWRHAITSCVYVEEDVVRVLYPARRWFSPGGRALLSDSDLEDLTRWLKDAEAFDRDTTDRKTALTRLVPEPW